MRTDGYVTEGFFDELFERDGVPRKDAGSLFEKIESLARGELHKKQEAAEVLLLNMGVTFNVYNSAAGKEKIFPFDIV